MYFVEGEVNEEWAIAKIDTSAAIGVAVGLLDDFIRAIKNGETDEALLDAFKVTRDHLKTWIEPDVVMTEEQFQKMFNYTKTE